MAEKNVASISAATFAATRFRSADGYQCFANAPHAARKTPPDIPSQITPQNANRCLNETRACVPMSRGSYRLTRIARKTEGMMRPRPDGVVEFETTSMTEKARTPPAAITSPSSVIRHCHELFRELDLFICR